MPHQEKQVHSVEWAESLVQAPDIHLSLVFIPLLCLKTPKTGTSEMLLTLFYFKNLRVVFASGQAETETSGNHEADTQVGFPIGSYQSQHVLSRRKQKAYLGALTKCGLNNIDN